MVAIVNAIPNSDWEYVPGGLMMHKSCIHEVPSGQLIENHMYRDEDCEFEAKQIPDIQFYPMQANYQPPSGTITQMNTSFVVPPTPFNMGTVFLWPGFKGGEPIIGKPVIQPVLEYGNGGTGGWILRSWLVGVGASMRTAPIQVKPGDLCTTYIGLSNSEWSIYGKDTRTGQVADLHVTEQRAGEYNWGVQVMETIVPKRDCSYYPHNAGINFTGITAMGVVPTWIPKVSATDCNQKVTIVDSGKEVHFSWTSEPSEE